jgi:hypothetical protein
MTPKQKYSQKLKSNWEEVNLSNLLTDAPRMTVSQLASRYRVSLQTILNYLNKYKVECKTTITKWRIPTKADGSIINPSRIDCANVYPKHQHFQRAV